MNPGTSEMHFVQALDSVPAMRGVLTLFEGVATGAADGYAASPAARRRAAASRPGARERSGQPAQRAPRAHPAGVRRRRPRHRPPAPRRAAAVRHRRARRTVSGWVHTSGDVRDVAADAVRAVQAPARTADRSRRWCCRRTCRGPGGRAGARAAGRRAVRRRPRWRGAGAALRRTAAMLCSAGRADRRGRWAARRSDRRRHRRPARWRDVPAAMERGAGLPRVERLAYLAARSAQLAGLETWYSSGRRSPCRSSATPGARRPRARRVRGRLARRARPDAVGGAGGAGRLGARDVEPSSATVVRRTPDRAARRPVAAAAMPRPCPRTPSWSTRRSPRASRLPALARRPDTRAHADRRSHRPGSAGRNGRGDRGAGPAGSRVQADGSALYTIQACGPRPASTSTSRPWSSTTRRTRSCAWSWPGPGRGTASDRAVRMLDLGDPTPASSHQERGRRAGAG